MSLATASAAVTRHPKKVGATAAHLDTSLCLSFEEVALQLVKQGVETGPRIVSSNLRANLLSSSVSAPSKQMSGVGVNDLKAHVLRSKRRNMTVTLDMDTLEVKDLHLHEVDGTFAHKMMSAWIPAAVGEKCMGQCRSCLAHVALVLPNFALAALLVCDCVALCLCGAVALLLCACVALLLCAFVAMWHCLVESGDAQHACSRILCDEGIESAFVSLDTVPDCDRNQQLRG